MKVIVAQHWSSLLFFLSCSFFIFIYFLSSYTQQLCSSVIDGVVPTLFFGKRQGLSLFICLIISCLSVSGTSRCSRHICFIFVGTDRPPSTRTTARAKRLGFLPIDIYCFRPNQKKWRFIFVSLRGWTNRFDLTDKTT